MSIRIMQEPKILFNEKAFNLDVIFTDYVFCARLRDKGHFVRLSEMRISYQTESSFLTILCH